MPYIKLAKRLFLSFSIGSLCALGFSQTSTGWHQWSVADGGNGHWYEGVSNGSAISWDDAEAHSISQGGYLATITSAQENAFVFNLIDNLTYWHLCINGVYQYMGPWLGAFAPEPRTDPTAGWQWVTGETFSYSNWNGGEPNNAYGTENSLMFITTLGAPPYTGPNPPTLVPTWNDLAGDPSVSRIFGQDSVVTSYVIERDCPPPVPEHGSILALGVPALGLFLKRPRK